MQVFHGHVLAQGLPPKGAVALGNFDGVHKGHQALVSTAKAQAAATGGPTVVFTFEPHPTRVLAPHLAPPLILPLDQRLERLESLGVDAVVLQPFTPEFARTSAADFVTQALVGSLRANAVVIGFNFTFGHKRAGNPALLQALGAQLGFGVHVVPEVSVDGLPCSSTKVRELLLGGNVEGAQLVMGRPFALRGTVVKGHQRGRLLGFPTANLQASVELLPGTGVYAGWVRPLDAQGGGPWPAVVNVGVAPTFGGGPVTVEAHLLDVSLDLYGRPLQLDFLHRIREERRFPGVESLKAQIALDAQTARQLLGAAPP
jgi:riboflavin kinase/FMN adenylyltransferase